MACFRAVALVIGVAAMVAIFVPSTMAKDYVVGDDNGWMQNFDYQAWAQGKQFYVGDTLLFKYPEGVHNVRKVNGTAFQQCVAPADADSLTSGNDIVTLAKPGPKWYICSKGNHCAVGNMRLRIDVLAQVGSPGSAPGMGPSSAVPISAGITRAGSAATTAWIMVILGFAIAVGLY
ncbi:hypothetical protein MLD38_015447 [Melastoma candidum]|uniref:Uncharacterized protein n=1 Tax=Melastoma candidum TaxID=119954 RepID=A0ACB9RJ88_9MYRT|nr:hypothetical protein MLD38_015447 [Melastoma candidum]